MSLFSPPDPAQSDYSHLEHLACGYWPSEVFFLALNFDLFAKIGTGIKNLGQFGLDHDLDPSGLQRLFPALQQLGLLEHEGGYWFPSSISRTYLDRKSPDCMLDFFLYRQYMQKGWGNLAEKIGPPAQPNITPESPYSERNFHYVKALDLLARQKGVEIVARTRKCAWQGPILDIGGGAGALSRAFLQERPEEYATVFDLAEVHKAARIIYPHPSDWRHLDYIEGDFSKHTFAGHEKFGLILMANFLHAYDAGTAKNLLTKACSLLADGGTLIIHDYFPDRQTSRNFKAILYDLHMLANTYNGTCHRSDKVINWLVDSGLSAPQALDLDSDSSLIIASQSGEPISVAPDWLQLAQEHGFRTGVLLEPRDVITAPWVALKCQFGCKKFAKGLQCPPFSMDADKTRQLLDSYTKCLLVEGTPPGHTFHQQLLDLERSVFLQGKHKALIFGAGPCSLCPTCDINKPCVKPGKARPAMEACGIDVYETMKKAGLGLSPRTAKDQYVKYVGLLLLE